MMEMRKIEEASVDCGVPREIILHYVEEEWVIPANPDKAYFDEEDIARIKFIWELHSSWGVNEESIPIILHLIDQLNRIHLELSKFRIH